MERQRNFKSSLPAAAARPVYGPRRGAAALRRALSGVETPRETV